MLVYYGHVWIQKFLCVGALKFYRRMGDSFLLFMSSLSYDAKNLNFILILYHRPRPIQSQSEIRLYNPLILIEIDVLQFS